MKTYIGSNDELDAQRRRPPHCGTVWVEDRPNAATDATRYRLPLRTQKGAHYPKSPDGHAWGYGGSGPSQLALDILWDLTGEEPHPAVFQALKRRFIEPCRSDTFVLTEAEVLDFLRGVDQ